MTIAHVLGLTWQQIVKNMLKNIKIVLFQHFLGGFYCNASIPADRVTHRLSKYMLIVKITCFIVEIFALKANVLREISTKKQESWDIDGSQPKVWWISNKRYKLQQWIFSKPCVQKIWNRLLQIENCKYFWKMLS